jgi:hypothetical protein
MILLLAASVLIPACTPFGIPALYAPPDGRFEDPEISESSGIVKSRRFDGLFWTHNDSGHPPRLFAINRDGGRVGTVDLIGAANIDWEDIAIDNAGFLYLCDIGDNKNRRKNVTVYQVPEVDPREVQQATVSARYTFRYPGLRSPNAEACFFHQGALYILTKEPGRGNTDLYRFDLSDFGRQEELTFIAGTDPEGSVTAADLSADGAYLAILTYSSILIFRKPPQGDNYLAGPPCRMSLRFGQMEAIAWDGDDLIITNEENGLLRLEKMALSPPTCLSGGDG